MLKSAILEQGRAIRRPVGMAAWAAAGGVTLIAVLLRLPAFDNRPFWIDELWRASLILEPRFWHAYWTSPSSESAITSPFYAILVKSLALVSVRPDTLRLSSFIPGVLSVPLSFMLVRRAGGAVELAVSAALIFAFHQQFISYSNEMKPYMLEVFVHLACIYGWFAIVTAPSPARRAWMLYFSGLIAALLATPTTIFLLPASGASLFLRFLANRDSRNLAICMAGFAILAACALTLYVVIWRYGADSGMVAFWADGFARPGANYAQFLRTQLSAMWRASFEIIFQVPKMAILIFAGPPIALVTIWVTGQMAKRTVRHLLLFYFILLVTLCALNFIKLWPLGASRQNLFLYGDAIAFFFLLIALSPWSRWAAYIFLAVIGLTIARHAYAIGVKNQYHQLMTQLAEYEGAPVERSDLVVEDFSHGGAIGKGIDAGCAKGKALIAADGYMNTAIAYYTKFDDQLRSNASLLIGPCVRRLDFGEASQSPQILESQLKNSLPGAAQAWFLYTHSGPQDVAAIRRIAGKFGRLGRSKEYAGGAGYFELIAPGSSD